MPDELPVRPEPIPAPPSPFMISHAKKVLLVVLMIAALPALILVARQRNLIDSRANNNPITSVRIDPGQIVTPTLVGSYNLSALAFDSFGNPVHDGIQYLWGMSSTGSIGNLIPDPSNTKLARFVLSGNSGMGDIWVRALEDGQSITASIPVKIGIINPSVIPTGTPPPPTPTHTLYPTLPPPVSPMPTSPPTTTPTPPVPTPTKRGGQAPTATPTPIPPGSNTNPTITTIALWPPVGLKNSVYDAPMSASDTNAGDVLSMSVSSTGNTFSLTNCTSTTVPAYLTCRLTGVPPRAGVYTIVVTASDQHGGTVTRSFSLPVLGL